MSEDKKINYLDGIKAVAMVMVFNIHFLNAYYVGIYTLNPEHFHTTYKVEWWIGATPLNLIYAGKLGARIFLVISAFLLARKYFLSGEKIRIYRDFMKKYIRLVPPILVVNLMIYAVMSLDWFYNDQAATLANSVEFFGSYNQFVPNLWEAVKEAVWGCFVFGENRYNGPLWFIQYEFWGCMLVVVILKLAGSFRWRYIIYAAIALLLIRTDYLGMVLGMVLADVTYTQTVFVDKIGKQKWLMWIMFFMGLYFVTYPSYGAAEGTMYEIFPPKVLFYYNIAIPVMLFAVMKLLPLQKIFSFSVLRKFTKVSYCFYLVHFPMLCTISSAFFVSMYGKINYHLLVLLDYVLTFTASYLLAWVLTKWVDGSGKKIVERIPVFYDKGRSK